MFVGKKIEVQLFGGTINVRNVPQGSPFNEDSIVSEVIFYNNKEILKPNYKMVILD